MARWLWFNGGEYKANTPDILSIMSIQLRFGNIQFLAQLLASETFVSPSTGATLGKLRVSFSLATGEDKNLIAKILEEHRSIQTLSGEGQTPIQWKPRQISYHYSDNNPATTYVWELVQQEVLALEALRLNDFEILPYSYKEDFDDKGCLRIDARARLDPDQLKRLRSLPQYFSVVRKGINDTPREMRFGRLLWSSHTDFVKHDIYLVDRAMDAEKRPALFQPELSHFATRISQQWGLIDGIFSALKAKGVLDDTCIQQIREQAISETEGHLPEFTRVTDLDEWKYDEQPCEASN